MPHEAARQRRARRNDDRLDRIDHRDARQLADAVGRKVGLGKTATTPGTARAASRFSRAMRAKA